MAGLDAPRAWSKLVRVLPHAEPCLDELEPPPPYWPGRPPRRPAWTCERVNRSREAGLDPSRGSATNGSRFAAGEGSLPLMCT